MSNKQTVERCPWSTKTAHEQAYHDAEWGVPVYDDRLLFEMIILEGAQAGLSWSTVLAKRAGYQKAFHHFEVEKVAQMSDRELVGLQNDASIIRHKLKIKSVVTNAQAFMTIQKEFGSFSKYLWAFVNNQPLQNNYTSVSEVPVSTDVSDKLSKDLKKRGFKFVGTTICYAYMQAVGMVNDHLTSCFRHADCQ